MRLRLSSSIYFMLWKIGFWIVLRKVRFGMLGPYDPVLFSERNGYRKPVFRLFGFRFFIDMPEVIHSHYDPVTMYEILRVSGKEWNAMRFTEAEAKSVAADLGGTIEFRPADPYHDDERHYSRCRDAGYIVKLGYGFLTSLGQEKTTAAFLRVEAEKKKKKG